jgi:hypothetical protein
MLYEVPKSERILKQNWFLHLYATGYSCIIHEIAHLPHNYQVSAATEHALSKFIMLINAQTVCGVGRL